MIVVDAQLPPALVSWFAARGYAAQHVGALAGDPAATDEAIWKLAHHAGWTIISKDQDFADRATLRGPPPQVIHLQLGNCSNNTLLAHLARCWTLVADALAHPETSLITIGWSAVGVHSREVTA